MRNDSAPSPKKRKKEKVRSFEKNSKPYTVSGRIVAKWLYCLGYYLKLKRLLNIINTVKQHSKQYGNNLKQTENNSQYKTLKEYTIDNIR